MRPLFRFYITLLAPLLRFYTILFALLLSPAALAMGPATGSGDVNPPLSGDQVVSYYEADKFQWTNYNDDVHLLLAYGGALTLGLILEHQFGMKRWQAALIGAGAMGLFGTVKEVLHDNYTSKTDQITWWAGGLTAGMTMTVMSF